MDAPNAIAAVVLAGGRSERMGQDKASLPYAGCTLLEHMVRLLTETGIDAVYVSGRQDEHHPSISDSVQYAGPAQAIADSIHFLHARGVQSALFVPVDMPLLTSDALRNLLEQPAGAYYDGYPLPVFVPCVPNIMPCVSVKEIIRQLSIRSIPCEQDACMQNFNTPEQWNRLVRA